MGSYFDVLRLTLRGLSLPRLLEVETRQISSMISLRRFWIARGGKRHSCLERPSNDIDGVGEGDLIGIELVRECCLMHDGSDRSVSDHETPELLFDEVGRFTSEL